MINIDEVFEEACEEAGGEMKGTECIIEDKSLSKADFQEKLEEKLKQKVDQSMKNVNVKKSTTIEKD